MNLDKIKNEIGSYLFEFWCNASDEQIKSAKSEIEEDKE